MAKGRDALISFRLFLREPGFGLLIGVDLFALPLKSVLVEVTEAQSDNDDASPSVFPTAMVSDGFFFLKRRSLHKHDIMLPFVGTFVSRRRLIRL